jgi:PleD family two-component response regulator
MVQQQLPQLMVLDINLPDIDGYTLCKQMRTNTRTKHIPIIFLTEKDERGDRIAGLELGADDYITKPFDIEELRLRIANAIRASERMGLTDPRSGLPSGRLIEDALREVIRKPKWAYFDMRIGEFDPFRDKYGFVAGDEVLRFTAMLISEVVDANGTPDDFIGHAGNDNFILISYSNDVLGIQREIERKFNESVKAHYSFIDREQGGIKMEENGIERMVPLMTIAVGVVTSERDFSDIREITEAAAEERRKIFASGMINRGAVQAALKAAQGTPLTPSQPPAQQPAPAPSPSPAPSPAAPTPAPAAPNTSDQSRDASHSAPTVQVSAVPRELLKGSTEPSKTDNDKPSSPTPGTAPSTSTTP